MIHTMWGNSANGMLS